MKNIIISLLFFSNCFSLVARIPSINKTRITNGWEFIRQDMADIWEVMRPARAGQPESVPLWQSVTLPHCFNAEDAVDPDCNYYQGAGWYRTCLSIDNPYKNGRTLLEFEGAGQETDVYIYTTKIGSHVGGYDNWFVDITEEVNSFSKTSICQNQFKGKIPIAIRCDNGRNTERIPSSMSDFILYGGLYRPVNIVYTPCISFKQIKIDPQMDKDRKKGNVNMIVSIYNPLLLNNNKTDAAINLTVKDPQGIEVYNYQGPITISDTNHISFTINSPTLWDVENPKLYTCSITLTVDKEKTHAVERFGFRDFVFKEKGPFLLNGKRLLLQGTHRHEDHAGVGAAMTEEMMIKEMKMIKDMGANFIRLGHYQQSNIILDLCDELGILVWEEIPWCRGGLGNDAYKAQARQMLTNMIEQHYNHPSIILWGLGNENDWPGDFPTFDKDSIQSFMIELNNLAHSLDNRRMTCIRRCDFCKEIVDVYSPSIWAGWYSNSFTDYANMATKEQQKVKHFFHAEWGGDSHAGRHAEDNFVGTSNAASKGDWSETYIIRLFDWHLKEQENMPWLSGSAFWTFKDFATPLRPENPIPYVNQKGVVQRDLNPKESYYVFQSYWAKKPMVHIYGHNWEMRWGKPNEAKEILVYSNCPEVELIVNGVSQGKKKRNSQNFPAAGLHWYVPLREGNNKIKAVALCKKGVITDSIVQGYQTKQWGEEAKIAMSYSALGGDSVLVKAQIMDKEGIYCLDSNTELEFQIAGEGHLIQNQGTVTGSRKIQCSNGKASIKAVVSGKSTIYAKAINSSNKLINDIQLTPK